VIRLFTVYYKETEVIRLQELELCRTLNMERFGSGYTLHHESEGHRTTYQELFDKINDTTKEGDINIIANSDIYFDDTISMIESIGEGECYALTRYNVQRKNVFEDTPGSQDVWIFRGKIKDGCFDVPMGVPGCDNRIAYELNSAGYKLYNPSLAIKCYHLHNSPKSYTNNTKRVERPYMLIPIISMPKRIFHISLGIHQRAQIKALEGIGAYESIDWTRAKESISERIDVFNPEIIFMQLQREGIVTPEMAKKWSDRGIKVINWTGDVRAPLPMWYLEVGKECHISLFTNQPDINKMRLMGCRADFLNIGYDQRVYYPYGKKIDCPDIVFLGNNYNHFPLSEERKQMVTMLRDKFGDSFGLYGTGWGGLEDGDYNGDEMQEAMILRSCKIAINLSHFNYRRYSSDRMQRILGCGAMCITHNFKGLNIDYKDNVHLKTYNSIHELFDLCRYYLLNDEERKQIALNGWRLAYNTQTWVHRIKEMRKWL